MPYKDQLIRFMKAKAAYLPNEVRDMYFTESDEESIRDRWTSTEAEMVIKMLQIHMEDDQPWNDWKLCPFCIHAEHHCNKCSYFQIHGVCMNPHSHYNDILLFLYKGFLEDRGIVDYIRTEHGDDAIRCLRKIITLAS